MPHLQAKRYKNNSLDAARARLHAMAKSRQLSSILKFDTNRTYYVFHSTKNQGQQMYAIGASILKSTPHYGRDAGPEGLQLAKEVADLLKERDSAGPGSGAWGGHSEEHMISFWDMCLRECPDPPTKAEIWNSDSPCRTDDTQPSNNLANWPTSCTLKLGKLARDNPTIAFTVHIGQLFRTLVQTDDPVGTLATAANAANLKFVNGSE